MVTINTPDELLRVLREKPEWKEAVRREILSEELMNLPARFDRFVQQQQQFNEKQRQFNEEQLQFNEEQRQFNARVDGFIERTNQRFDRIEEDISNMRGEYARNSAVSEAEDIAEDMGFRMVRTLAGDDLRELLRTSDTSGMAASELRSFRRADLVIEAADEDGATHYIAVESSNTADERDTRRAIRNAGFLTRFTGQPARSAIASVRNDHRIQNIIDSGQVYWHALANRDSQAE
jgi:hypothetical protein